VFEYAEGDTILGGRFKAPRSNRFYFVHDPNGGKIKQLEVYHKLVAQKYPEVKRHMFGGYQLLQKMSDEDVEKRL
jgi:ADP-dependent phosphofructokinase/glucokinase